MSITWLKKAAQIWREFVTDNVQSSGAYEVKKSDIRKWGKQVEDLLENFTAMRPADIVIRDEKTANTGGGAFTSGAWRDRTLQTVARNVDEAALSPLTSNVVTLPTGDWLVRWRAAGYNVGSHQTRWVDVTGSTVLKDYSVTERTAVDAMTWSSGFAILNITAASASYKLQHWCTTTNGTDGFGKAANIATVERYAEVEIFRISDTVAGALLAELQSALDEIPSLRADAEAAAARAENAAGVAEAAVTSLTGGAQAALFATQIVAQHGGVAALGDSLTEGYSLDATSVDWLTKLAPRINGTLYKGGVGGNTSTQIKDRYLALNSTQKGYDLIVWPGSNDSGTTFSWAQTIINNIAAMVAAAGHQRFVIFPPFVHSSRGGWLHIRALLKQLSEFTYRGHVYDLTETLRLNGDGSDLDKSDALAGYAEPRSLTRDPDGTLYGGGVDRLHQGATGQAVTRNVAEKFVAAMNGLAPLLPPRQTIYTYLPNTAVPSVLGRNNKIDFLGSATWCRMEGAFQDVFSIDNDGILSWRESVDASSLLGIYDLQVTVGNEYGFSTGIVEVLVGANEVLPHRVLVSPGSAIDLQDGFGSIDSGGCRLLMPFNGAVSDGKKGSIFFVCHAWDDSSNMSMIGGYVAIYRGIDGTWTCLILDPTDSTTAILAHTTGASYKANGVEAHGLSFDLDAGTMQWRINGSDRLASSPTINTAKLLPWSKRMSIWGGDGLGVFPWYGLFDLIWITITKIDWSNSGNWAVFFDNSTKLSQATASGPDGNGVVLSATPFLYVTGRSGDLYWGRNLAPNQFAGTYCWHVVPIMGGVVIDAELLANNASSGFLYLPTVNGTPTGTPIDVPGHLAVAYDVSADKIWAYRGGWKSTAALS